MSGMVGFHLYSSILLKNKEQAYSKYFLGEGFAISALPRFGAGQFLVVGVLLCAL